MPPGLLRADIYVGPYHVVLEDTLCTRLTSRVDSLLEHWGPAPCGSVAYISGSDVTLYYQAGAWVLFD